MNIYYYKLEMKIVKNLKIITKNKFFVQTKWKVHEIKLRVGTFKF